MEQQNGNNENNHVTVEMGAAGYCNNYNVYISRDHPSIYHHTIIEDTVLTSLKGTIIITAIILHTVIIV